VPRWASAEDVIDWPLAAAFFQEEISAQ
jgi:hypothetical protein